MSCKAMYKSCRVPKALVQKDPTSVGPTSRHGDALWWRPSDPLQVTDAARIRSTTLTGRFIDDIIRTYRGMTRQNGQDGAYQLDSFWAVSADEGRCRLAIGSEHSAGTETFRCNWESGRPCWLDGSNDVVPYRVSVSLSWDVSCLPYC